MTFLLIVTVSSMLLAAIMSFIAWRIAAEERRRSDARIAALSAEIHAAAGPRTVAAQSGGRRDVAVRGESRLAPFPLVQRTGGRWTEDLAIRPSVDRGTSAPDLFRQPETRSRGPIVAVAGGIVVVGAIALLVVVAARRPPVAATSPTAPAAASPGRSVPQPATATAAGPVSSTPLELVALGHERDGDRLIVRGVVRNTSSAATAEQLTAVVLAYGSDGAFLSTGRGIIESAALRPGAQSTFVVTVHGASAVGRYRVSFRNGDRIVPHVDRRGPAKVSP